MNATQLELLLAYIDARIDAVTAARRGFDSDDDVQRSEKLRRELEGAVEEPLG